jgi:hypothetical protein
MTQKNDIGRRNFMKTVGVTAGAMAMSAKSYGQITGANNRLKVGFIGCGGMAGAHLGSLLAMKDKENVDVVAVTDVYEKHAKNFQDRVAGEGGSAKICRDHEELLNMSDIDYVVIATPEHSHQYLTCDALDAGKHVYCEKPMTHTVSQAWKVVDKVNETGLKMQVGVQAMADDSYSSAYQAIQSGILGQVVEAQIDYVRNYPNNRGPWRRDDINDDTPQPDNLDWHRWLKPHRKDDWNPHHYYEWRCYRAFSGGVSTDLFVHRITRIIKACGLSFPTRGVGLGGIYNWDDGRDLPDSLELLLEYPAVEGVGNGMTVRVLGTMANKHRSEHCIRGKEATLFFRGKGWEIESQADGKVIASHIKTGGEDITPHHINHHESIRNGAELNCPAETGLYAVVAVRMGNYSWEKGKMVEWNARRKKLVTA